jgi:hypothetical protein
MQVLSGSILARRSFWASPCRAGCRLSEPNPNKPFVEARGNVIPVPLPPGGPAPKMADGHVDLWCLVFGTDGKANAWSVVPDKADRRRPVPFRPEVEAKSPRA